MQPDLVPMLQPHDTPMCGQTCVAMIAGCSLHEAHTAVGVSILRDEGTFTKHLVRGLKRLGVKVGTPIVYDRTDREKGRPLIDLPRFALMTVADSRTQWAHAVVLKDGFVYDPGIGWPLPVFAYENLIIERAYSRRYRKKSLNSRKGVKAYWAEAIPILAVPKRTA